ncbi:hypothetical protein AB6F55_17325 [Providencia hangzhouensis]
MEKSLSYSPVIYGEWRYFSCAQQLANKSRLNVIGIKGEYISTSADNRQQQVLFRPQNKLLRIISKLGNLLLSK